MDTRKCSGKIAMLAAIILGLCGIGQAQTCSVNVASAQPPNQIQLAATESGTAVSSIWTNLSGGGKGPVGGSIIKSTGGFTFASAGAVTGDFTFTTELAGVSGISGNGGTELGAGASLLIMEGGLALTPDKLYSWGVHINGGLNYLELNNGTTKNSAQWLSKGNLFSQVGYHPYLKIQRTGTTYTFSDSVDGISWTQHATAASGNGGGSTVVGLAAWSGDTTGSSGQAAYSHVLLNGATVNLIDSDYWTTGGVTGSITPQVVPGTLTFGPDLAFGQVIYSFVGTGCLPATVAGLQARINNSTYRLGYSIVVLNNGLNVFSIGGISPLMCVTCTATLTSDVGSMPLVSGQIYYVTKRVSGEFIDGSGPWASTFLSGGDPIVQQITLQP